MKTCSRVGEKRLPGIKAGFTLVELLAVIAILLVLAAAITLKPRSGNPLDATRQVMGIFAAAQERARASGLPVRILFCKDPAAGERYLRSVALLVDADGSASTVGWRLGERIETLPTGTIFSEQYSSTIHVMQYDFASHAIQSGSTGSTCVYVEFDGLGETNQGGEQFVFVEGHTAGASLTPPMNLNNRDGFILRRVGALAQFKSPDQIQPASP